MPNELIIIMIWSWLQGYSAGIESAEEKIKKVFADAEDVEEEEEG